MNTDTNAKAEYAPWSKRIPELLDEVGVNIETGLSSAEVEARRQRHGENELTKEPGTPLWKLILNQFDDMLVKVASKLTLAFN